MILDRFRLDDRVAAQETEVRPRRDEQGVEPLRRHRDPRRLDPRRRHVIAVHRRKDECRATRRASLRPAFRRKIMP